MTVEYEIIRSARRTVAIQIRTDGSVLVRAPRRCSKSFIDEFVREKQDWIVRKQQELQSRREQLEEESSRQPVLTEADRRQYQHQAAEKIAEKVAEYGEVMGVTYGRITIRDQKTRWGSCSTRGNLNFNWRLILAPEEVLDYVVVHELAHRKEMNHSDRFWREVEKILPDYRARRLWLKKNGGALLAR